MKVSPLLASLVLILLCSVVLSETYQIRVTYNTNLRASYSLDSAVLASAPAGTTVQVVGQHSRWLQINRGGRHYWMANWVAYTRVGNQQTTRDADIDNCGYVNRQCAIDHDWVVGWHAFQLNECPVSQPVAPASAPVSAPASGQPIDNCCFSGLAMYNRPTMDGRLLGISKQSVRVAADLDANPAAHRSVRPNRWQNN